MNSAKELIQYDGYDLSELRGTFKRSGYDVAFGHTYSIQEIRKAIQDNQVAFVKVGNSLSSQTICVVGENEDSLVAFRKGELYEVEDKALLKAWTGEAVIVLGRPEGQSEQASPGTIRKAYAALPMEKESSGAQVEAPVDDFVIFAPERDNWKPELEGVKQKGKRGITRVKFLDCCELPTHPVIVVFREATDKIKKEGIRAANNGVEVQLYDPSDPLAQFLHELGHVYWNTRMIDQERKLFQDFQKTLKKETLPAIFQSNWGWHNGEEVFCTLYMWYGQGQLCHGGYNKILEQQCPEGSKMLSGVFSRVRRALDSEVDTKTYKAEVKRLWSESERSVSIWLNNLLDKPSLALVKGKGLLKSRIPAKDILPYDFPVDDVANTFLGEHKGRTWLMVDEGLLKGKVIVLKAGALDIKYMKSKQNYYLVPTEKRVQSRGRHFTRVGYVSPRTILKARSVAPEKPGSVSGPGHEKSVEFKERILGYFKRWQEKIMKPGS